MNRHYSGHLSREFWRRVNALPEPFRDDLYGMGCLIQDYEYRLLKKLERAEKMTSKNEVTASKCKNRHCQTEIEKPGRCEQCQKAWDNTCRVAKEAYSHRQKA